MLPQDDTLVLLHLVHMIDKWQDNMDRRKGKKTHKKSVSTNTRTFLVAAGTGGGALSVVQRRERLKCFLCFLA